MRSFIVFQIVTVLFFGIFAASASHASGIGDYIWGPPQSDFVRPYLEKAKLPHNSRWADDEWTPQDWIESRGGNAIAVINGFYEAGIISDQYFDDDVPVLEVGQNFLELGAKEKRRVVAFVDDVFGVTKFSQAGVILIYFQADKKDEPVGLFSAQGLQLQ